MPLTSHRQKKFRTLTQPWRDRLYAIALRQADTADEAEVWLQETLLRAWRDMDDLSDNTTSYSWLLKILDHVIADDRRRSHRRRQIAPVINVDDSVLNRYAEAAPGPFEQLLQQQKDVQLLQLIRALPENFQRVVVYRDIEGISYREIAYILDIPPGTVMSRLSRGRRLLATQLIKHAAIDLHGQQKKPSEQQSP